MKLVSFDQRLPGDLGFVRRHNLMGDLIVDFLSALHDDYNGGFVPTHVFIVDHADMVIETNLSFHENSAAAVSPISEYEHLPVQLWRIDRNLLDIARALNDFAAEYAHDGSGLVHLFGFAREAMLRHYGTPKASNPVLLSYACAQAALLFLRYPSNEKWPLTAELRDCDPLQLLMWCLANQPEQTESA